MFLFIEQPWVNVYTFNNPDISYTVFYLIYVTFQKQAPNRKIILKSSRANFRKIEESDRFIFKTMQYKTVFHLNHIK